ncbi:MAG TPA: amidase [Candidatus Cybelea sp.]|nr:amidase [Candidatus Cybelea sp.]
MAMGMTGAVEASRLIANKDLTCEALLRQCLSNVLMREKAVGAWAFLDEALALKAARAADQGLRAGPLHGIPVGVKDIIDTENMPTEYGSPIYAGHRPERDAECVRRLQQADGYVLGKTVTTEFAFFTPGKTANPHNTGHTPGGSSSGSAAAVADGMVPLAFGTQTSGSVIRPASFCGIYGFKGTHGWIPMDGVKPFAPSLDTLGIFARDIHDLELFRTALLKEKAEPLPQSGRAPRLAFYRTPYWDKADPAMQRALETAAKQLAAEGVQITDAKLPFDGASLTEAQQSVIKAEAAQSFAEEYETARDRLSPALRELIEEGRAVSPSAVADASATARRARRSLGQVFDGTDAIVTLAAPGEAPKTLLRTGDPVFNRMWTLIGVPCLTFPIGRGPQGLPLGIQLVGATGHDRRLMEVGAWVAKRIGRAVDVCITG